MTDDKRDKSKEATAGVRVLGKAMGGTVNIVVAGTAAVAAAAMHSIPVLAIGGVAYAALVAWDFVNPKFFKKALEREPVKMPDPSELRDLAVRDAIERLIAAREEVEKILDDLPASVTMHLASVLSSSASMHEHAASFAQRANALAEYLERAAKNPVANEITQIDLKIVATRDPEARAQYENARALRIEQAKAIEDIGNARERIVANLARIVATMEALPPKIVRLRALDDQAVDKLTGNINDELSSINGDLAAFEETLKSLTEVPA